MISPEGGVESWHSELEGWHRYDLADLILATSPEPNAPTPFAMRAQWDDERNSRKLVLHHEEKIGKDGTITRCYTLDVYMDNSSTEKIQYGFSWGYGRVCKRGTDGTYVKEIVRGQHDIELVALLKSGVRPQDAPYEKASDMRTNFEQIMRKGLGSAGLSHMRRLFAGRLG